MYFFKFFLSCYVYHGDPVTILYVNLEKVTWKMLESGFKIKKKKKRDKENKIINLEVTDA